MMLMSESSSYVCYWTNSRKNRIKIVSKTRKRRGLRPYTGYAYRDSLGRFIVDCKFPIPVTVRAWISKALSRGYRWR